MTHLETPPDPTNVVLTGFMGTGKTTVGRLVAERLGFSFVDTDELIEERHGPIAEIFATQGEDVFRSIERAVAAEVANRPAQVISTGGRLLLDPANEASLGRTGAIVCLTATVDQILDRVLSDPSRIDRPLLAVDDPRQRIIDLLAERSAGYGRFVQVDTGGRRPDAIADDVIARSKELKLMTPNDDNVESGQVGGDRLLGLADAYAVETPDDNRRLYADWAATYESEFIEPRGYIYHSNVADLFVKALGSGSGEIPVADVGCGTGIVGLALQERGIAAVDGIDLSPAMLEQAATKLIDGQPVYRRLIEADLTLDVALPAATYRGVVSVGTFTHGHLGPRSLDELIRIGTPNAVYAIGINAEHYDSHGFAEYFAEKVAAGTITEPTHHEVRIYAVVDDRHGDDLGLVAIFHKTVE